MRHGGDLSARFAGATVFSRLSRRRHIDLKRSTSCLCQAWRAFPPLVAVRHPPSPHPPAPDLALSLIPPFFALWSSSARRSPGPGVAPAGAARPRTAVPCTTSVPG